MPTELDEPKSKVMWPASSSQMAQRIRVHDWAATPLGPIETWPERLRSIVDTMLGCGFPTTVQWGPKLILLYNDAYISLVGGRHPSALGLPLLEAFPEIADTYSPFVDRILSG